MNEIGPSDRPADLSGVPSSMQPARPQTAEERQQQPPQDGPQPQYQQQTAPPPQQPYATTPGFDFNQPTILSILYISSFMVGFTAIVAVVLGYVWKGQPAADWEVSHYEYHIRTFWIAVIGTVISLPLMIVLVGFFVWFAVAALVVVRSIMSLIKAQSREPMPNPGTWLA